MLDFFKKKVSEELVSPRYYNYGTDRAFFEVEVDIKEYITENLLDKFYKTYYKIEEINLNQVIKCLTTSELHIIEAIGENKITMNELSDKLGITMGTASVAVNKLTDKQFLERSRSDADRRKVFVELTPKGMVALNYHGNFHSNILEKITDDIPQKKLDTFVEVFETIVKNNTSGAVW